MIGPQMSSALVSSRLSKIDFFGDLHSINDIQVRDFVNDGATFETEFEHYCKFCGIFVDSPKNHNLYVPQK